MGKKKTEKGGNQIQAALEMRDPAKLKPYVNNARTHSREQIEALKKSIAEFGFRAPVLATPDGLVLAGHGRLQAALEMGLAQIPVAVQAGLTDAQARAYVLADNKLAELAGWDDETLAAELLALDEEGFDLDVTGFDSIEEPEPPEEPQAGAGGGYKPPPPVYGPTKNTGANQSSTGTETPADPPKQADTQATIGEYRFVIPREKYLLWQEELRQTVGFEPKAIIHELWRRLGLV